jgi:hypothetical protein
MIGHDRCAVMFDVFALSAAFRDLLFLHHVDFWKCSGMNAGIGRD